MNDLEKQLTTYIAILTHYSERFISECLSPQILDQTDTDTSPDRVNAIDAARAMAKKINGSPTEMGNPNVNFLNFLTRSIPSWLLQSRDLTVQKLKSLIDHVETKKITVEHPDWKTDGLRRFYNYYRFKWPLRRFTPAFWMENFVDRKNDLLLICYVPENEKIKAVTRFIRASIEVIRRRHDRAAASRKFDPQLVLIWELMSEQYYVTLDQAQKRLYQEFTNATIMENKPQKILEIGGNFAFPPCPPRQAPFYWNFFTALPKLLNLPLTRIFITVQEADAHFESFERVIFKSVAVYKKSVLKIAGINEGYGIKLESEFRGPPTQTIKKPPLIKRYESIKEDHRGKCHYIEYVVILPLSRVMELYGRFIRHFPLENLLFWSFEISFRGITYQEKKKGRIGSISHAGSQDESVHSKGWKTTHWKGFWPTVERDFSSAYTISPRAFLPASAIVPRKYGKGSAHSRYAKLARIYPLMKLQTHLNRSNLISCESVPYGVLFYRDFTLASVQFIERLLQDLTEKSVCPGWRSDLRFFGDWGSAHAACILPMLDHPSLALLLDKKRDCPPDIKDIFPFYAIRHWSLFWSGQGRMPAFDYTGSSPAIGELGPLLATLVFDAILVLFYPAEMAAEVEGKVWESGLPFPLSRRISRLKGPFCWFSAICDASPRGDPMVYTEIYLEDADNFQILASMKELEPNLFVFPVFGGIPKNNKN